MPLSFLSRKEETATAGLPASSNSRASLGEIGFISPVSDHFCGSCNRLRLTADGKLKTCLFSEELTDLKPLLRSGAGDEDLANQLGEALRNKPLRHDPIGGVMKRCHLPMVKIGG